MSPGARAAARCTRSATGVQTTFTQMAPKRSQASTATAASRHDAAAAAGPAPKRRACRPAGPQRGERYAPSRRGGAAAAAAPAAAPPAPRLCAIRCTRDVEVTSYGEREFESPELPDDEEVQELVREAIDGRAAGNAESWLIGEGRERDGRPAAYASRRAAPRAAREWFVELANADPPHPYADQVDGNESEDYEETVDEYEEDLGGGLNRWELTRDFVWTETRDGFRGAEESDTTVAETITIEVLELDVVG